MLTEQDIERLGWKDVMGGLAWEIEGMDTIRLEKFHNTDGINRYTITGSLSGGRYWGTIPHTGALGNLMDWLEIRK